MRDLTESELLEALYNGAPIEKCWSSEVEPKYNAVCDLLDLKTMAKPIFTENWFMPDEYNKIDLIEFFVNKISTPEEVKRVADEISLFNEAGKVDLLRYLIYLGEVIKECNIVTGVGRGSSVSLYTLYLIGIHKVNSLKYNLNPHEFFKSK